MPYLRTLTFINNYLHFLSPIDKQIFFKNIFPISLLSSVQLSIVTEENDVLKCVAALSTRSLTHPTIDFQHTRRRDEQKKV